MAGGEATQPDIGDRRHLWSVINVEWSGLVRAYVVVQSNSQVSLLLSPMVCWSEVLVLCCNSLYQPLFELSCSARDIVKPKQKPEGGSYRLSV